MTDKPENTGTPQPQASGKPPGAKQGGLFRFVVELSPLLLFFYINGEHGIIPATAVFVLATTLSLAIIYWRERRLALMPLIATIVVLVFGGLTVVLEDEIFIKLKPTIVNGIFAAILLGGLAMGRPLLRPLFGDSLDLTQTGWLKLTRRWALFFIALAIANEIAWRTLGTDDWVSFKVFGLLPAAFIFAMLQTPLILRHQRKPAGRPGAD
ncbi:MAG: septation protein A [Alphaproteobacteria bacterium]